ncbi:MAG TPA: hypothetical protein VEA38_09375 [Terriglobales bacterium]|nr:hypothetical protein [Terriglobales bacterium]
MSDERLRDLERAAADGGWPARRALLVAQHRAHGCEEPTRELFSYVRALRGWYDHTNRGSCRCSYYGGAACREGRRFVKWLQADGAGLAPERRAELRAMVDNDADSLARWFHLFTRSGLRFESPRHFMRIDDLT